MYKKVLVDSKWKQAMQEEIDTFHNNHTWTFMPRKPNMNFINSK